jgi:hypothetical protein
MTISDDSDHDFFDSMGGLQTRDILNALKIGDTRLDMLLAMCQPFVFIFLFDAIGRTTTYMVEQSSRYFSTSIYYLPKYP